MSRVDAHVHLWDPAEPGFGWLASAPRLLRRRYGLAELRAAVAGAVDAVVVVQAAARVEETRALLALAAREPLPAGVVGWVPLASPEVPALLAGLRAGPGGERLAGVRANALQHAPEWAAAPEVRRGCTAVAAAGLVVELIADGPRLPAVAALAAALPQARIVVDHLGQPPGAGEQRRAWASALALLARHPGVHLKLSGTATLAGPLEPVVATALESFGAERLLFGSDWPVCLQRADHAGVVAQVEELLAGCSPAERAAVWGGAARRVYRLGAGCAGDGRADAAGGRRGGERAGGAGCGRPPGRSGGQHP